MVVFTQNIVIVLITTIVGTNIKVFEIINFRVLS